jgi:hypothetical protein
MDPSNPIDRLLYRRVTDTEVLPALYESRWFWKPYVWWINWYRQWRVDVRYRRELKRDREGR